MEPWAWTLLWLALRRRQSQSGAPVHLLLAASAESRMSGRQEMGRVHPRQLRARELAAREQEPTLRKGRPAGTRKDKYTDRGIGIWFLRDQLRRDVPRRRRLLQRLHEGARLPGLVNETTRVTFHGAERALLVEYSMQGGDTAAILVRMTIDDSEFTEKLPKSWSKIDLQWYVPDGSWDFTGWVFAAPEIYFDKVRASRDVPFCIAFEDLAKSSSPEVAGYLREGCDRANVYFENWGKPRVVPWWVGRR